MKQTLSWRQVLEIHRSRRGIAKTSLLVDAGESGYSNLFLANGSIQYPGEGRSGHQYPTKGNLQLINSVESRSRYRVFNREAPNVWTEIGLFEVESFDYALDETQKRNVFWFLLKPV